MIRYDVGYYNRPNKENAYKASRILRPDQYAALCYLFGLPFHDDDPYELRNPGRVVSIGCGEGILEAELERLGLDVIGVDPSPGAWELYAGSTLHRHYEGGGDTILFVESLEHLPEPVLWDVWQRIPVHARIIVTNWVNYHPIVADGTGWDHVTTVDDDLYDRLCEAHRVVKRYGSHLVLERTTTLAMKE